MAATPSKASALSDPTPGFPSSLVVPVSNGPDSLDFWVGTWDCVGKSKNPGKDEWTETKCTNRIERILGNKVIHENFENGGYMGQSWSVYNPQRKEWRQTWVDNQGGYIDLVGGAEQDSVVLRTIPNLKMPKAFSRMVFSDIERDAFKWRWEGTRDGGKTWNVQWKLEYRRRVG